MKNYALFIYAISEKQICFYYVDAHKMAGGLLLNNINYQQIIIIINIKYPTKPIDNEIIMYSTYNVTLYALKTTGFSNRFQRDRRSSSCASAEHTAYEWQYALLWQLCALRLVRRSRVSRSAPVYST
jgi:hypothetical protein